VLARTEKLDYILVTIWLVQVRVLTEITSTHPIRNRKETT